MTKRLNITKEQRLRAARRIENGFMFSEDVLADPTLLECIPEGAEVTAIPIEEREPGRRYDIETPRTVATITMPTPETAQAQPTSAARRR